MRERASTLAVLLAEVTGDNPSGSVLETLVTSHPITVFTRSMVRAVGDEAATDVKTMAFERCAEPLADAGYHPPVGTDPQGVPLRVASAEFSHGPEHQLAGISEPRCVHDGVAVARDQHEAELRIRRWALAMMLVVLAISAMLAIASHTRLAPGAPGVPAGDAPQFWLGELLEPGGSHR
jgi:hypothetical protein